MTAERTHTYDLGHGRSVAIEGQPRHWPTGKDVALRIVTRPEGAERKAFSQPGAPHLFAAWPVGGTPAYAGGSITVDGQTVELGPDDVVRLDEPTGRTTYSRLDGGAGLAEGVTP